MSQPTVTGAPAPTETRRRQLLHVAGVLGLVVTVGAVALFVLGKKGHEPDAPAPDTSAREAAGERLRDAVAAVDHLDPRWRLAELEEDRAKVSAAENAAPLVRASAILIPDEMKRLDHNVLRERLRNGTLGDKPRADIEPAKAMLSQARKLIDYSRGRHAVTWNLEDPLLTLLPHLRDTDDVVNLLTLDAEVRAHEGDVDGALVSAHAALVAARTTGDEPMLVSQLRRPGWHHYSAKALEESLRRGRGSEENLRAVQTALDNEAAEPLLRTTARAERAGLHGLMTALEKRELKYADWVLLGARAEGVSLILQRQSLSRHLARLEDVHAWLIDYTTQLVEIAGLPSREQAPRLQKLASATRTAPPEAIPLLAALPILDIDETCRKGQALLRCAAAGMALEQYRLANDGWPDNLDRLVPKYLAKVPADPFDGKPLRYAKYKEGVAVYSVGPGGKEGARPDDLDQFEKDGGSLVSFRLWNVESRNKGKP